MSGINKIDRPDDSVIDSIWSSSSPLPQPNGVTHSDRLNSTPLTSIFAAPISSKKDFPSTGLDGGATESCGQSQTKTHEQSLQRVLIVQSGGAIFALNAVAIQEVARVPDPNFFDSGPLATILHIRGRKLFFSALDSLMGVTTTAPKKGKPILIIGENGKEAALLVDRIIDIANIKNGQIMTEDPVFPNQSGWLFQENKKKAAIIDLRQVLDRILFETDRGNL